MAYARGKFAKAISDRSGHAFPYTEMKKEWNGSFVHKSEFESKHPQLDPIKHKGDAIALKDAMQNHSGDTWSFLGLGTSLFGWLVGGDMTDEFSEKHAFWGGLGLVLPYLAASRYKASNPSYPSKIKTLSEKKLYKTTYILETRRLRKVSVMVLPLMSLVGLFFVY